MNKNDTSGYFKRSAIDACSIENGGDQTLELLGDGSSKYIVAIDPSWSSSESADDFAMCVLKISEKTVSAVHFYAMTGCDLFDHIIYLRYLLLAFNIDLVVINHCDGNSSCDFIKTCNDSEVFRSHGVSISAENVLKVSLGTGFMKEANECLQSTIDNEIISFPSMISANSKSAEKSMKTFNTFIRTLLKNHSRIGCLSWFDFIENIDCLIHKTKIQCSVIEVRQASSGDLIWDLPESLRLDRSPLRFKKDLYIALLMAVWGSKKYLGNKNLNLWPANT